MSTKVVINECFGGFSLSAEAVELLRARTGDATLNSYYRGDRDDPVLVSVVEELGGTRAGGSYASLGVVEVPDGVKWHVHEYDGYETVHEDHRTWDSDGLSESC